MHLLGLQIVLFSLDQFKKSSSKWSDGSELLLTGAVLVESSAFLKRQERHYEKYLNHQEKH